MMTIAIVAVFIVGYACIALESGLKINKAATALLMCVACWVLYMTSCVPYVTQFHGADFAPYLAAATDGSLLAQAQQFVSEHILLEHLGDTCEIIVFLLGAMTIVEVVDQNGGFEFVRTRLRTTSKRALLWRIAFMTFFLSAILDNMTTSIVMVMVLRKLVADHKDRMLYASLVILAANAGGAFSPIGDVTTIMLWIAGNISTIGVMKELIIPSLVSMIVPALLFQTKLHGTLAAVEAGGAETHYDLSQRQRTAVFWIGVGGLVFVPIFRFLTGLPPFMGILLVLALLWTTTEIFYRSFSESETTTGQRVSQLLARVDLSTILFFLGILMTVATLQEIGVLSSFGAWVDEASGHNAYLVTGLIGVLSSVVDNVPLVAGCMGMYDIAPAAAALADPTLANFVQDGIFWQLLAYCAGVGGSMLIIGSAAGVVVMGLEKISFGWYLRHVTWIAFVGYVAGIAAYWLIRTFLW